MKNTSSIAFRSTETMHIISIHEEAKTHNGG